ncbi:hypothetical protein NL351_30615, partial [Klebsiella pneumoniae]|nr:hypothetical protein [Klebsiella pneumoniae]
MKLQSTADGLKAVKVNPYCTLQAHRDFETNNPELPLTTPMPGNTVFEGVEVWQYQYRGETRWLH